MKLNALTLVGGFSVILLLASCSSPAPEEPKQIDSQFLINCWTHSQEEYLNDMILIYRPCDFKEFGLSRYRDRINLLADSTVSYTVLSPVDAHTTEEGIWKYFSTEGILRILDADSQFVRDFEIVELQADKMSVKY